jgi:putative endonuclease
MKQYYVYIVSNKRNGTLYLGMTNNLIRRVSEHRQGIVEGFSKEHNTHSLVWYEVHETAESAIMREKQIKLWKREWKIKRIEELNPYWKDLYEDLNG